MGGGGGGGGGGYRRCTIAPAQLGTGARQFPLAGPPHATAPRPPDAPHGRTAGLARRAPPVRTSAYGGHASWSSTSVAGAATRPTHPFRTPLVGRSQLGGRDDARARHGTRCTETTAAAHRGRDHPLYRGGDKPPRTPPPPGTRLRQSVSRTAYFWLNSCRALSSALSLAVIPCVILLRDPLSSVPVSTLAHYTACPLLRSSPPP